jgi:hypothetical protein
LERIVNIDPTVKELCNLPLGWIAFRESLEHPWQCQCGEISEDDPKVEQLVIDFND